MSGTGSTYQPTVLVLHALRPTSRQTTIDHLLSFRDHLPDADVRYLHFQQPLPRAIGEISPDLLIVNYDYLNYRFTPLWPFIKKRHRDIARRAGKVVAIAQDDFWANKLLDDWCMDWDVDRILTPIDTDRDVLYPRSIKHKEFRTGLTGYVKSGPVPVTPKLSERTIDLGQRVRDMPPHLGRLAQAKSLQAVAMADAARAAGFKVDVSTRVEDSFIGAAWFNFLASCRFTVGMKGGASLHDPRGLIHTRVQSFRARRPEATFDEIEERCFRGRDMKHEFTAISPRLFESALAGTCQILQRDDYLGVLEPWRDYLPLEANLSNMAEIIGVMRDLEHCQEIVTNARMALVDSGVFDYARLVETATDGLLDGRGHGQSAWTALAQHLDASTRIFVKAGAELHDAVEHLASDILMQGEDPISKTVSREIRDSLARHELTDEMTRILDIQRSDRLSLKCPWIWRPVPGEGRKDAH
jgi:hypothetical protein